MHHSRVPGLLDSDPEIVLADPGPPPALPAPVAIIPHAPPSGTVFPQTGAYTGQHDDYAFTSNGTTVTVTDLRPGSPNGTTTLDNGALAQFSDNTFRLAYDGTQVRLIYQVVDMTGTVPWGVQHYEYDAKGSLYTYSIENHNGTTWLGTFDPDNTSSLRWSQMSMDANNRIETVLFASDDRTYTLAIYNSANTADVTISFDAQWHVTGTTGFDGHATTMAAIAAVYDTAIWYTTPYDPNQGAPVGIAILGGRDVDQLYGHAGADTLGGEAGNDVIVGGRGNDTLSGGTGDDRFVFTNGDGVDTITDFTPGAAGGDLIDLHSYGIAGFAALQSFMSQVGGDTVIAFDPLNQIVLKNVALSALDAGDFIFH